MCQAIVDGGRRCDIHRKEVSYFLPLIESNGVTTPLLRDTLQTLRTENRAKRFSSLKLERLYAKIREKVSESEFNRFMQSLEGEERISGPLLESLLNLENVTRERVIQTEKELRFLSVKTGLTYRTILSKYVSSRLDREIEISEEELDSIREYAKSRNLFSDKKSLIGLNEVRKLIQTGESAIVQSEIPHLSEVLVSGGYNEEANGRLELTLKHGEQNVGLVYENIPPRVWATITNPYTPVSDFLWILNAKIRGNRLLDVSDAEASRRLINCANCGQFRGVSHSCPPRNPEEFFSEVNVAATANLDLPPVERSLIEDQIINELESQDFSEVTLSASGSFLEKYFVEETEEGSWLEVRLKQSVQDIIAEVSLGNTISIPIKVKFTDAAPHLGEREVSGFVKIRRREDGLLEVVSYERDLTLTTNGEALGSYNKQTEYVYRNFLGIMDEINRKSRLSPYGISREDLEVSRNPLGEVILTRTSLDGEDSIKLNSASVYGQTDARPVIIGGLNEMSAQSNNPLLSPLLYNLYHVREVSPSLNHQEINAAFSTGVKKINMSAKMRVGTNNGRDRLHMNLTLAKNEQGEIYVQDTSFVSRCTCGRFMSAYGGFCAHEESLRVFGGNILTQPTEQVDSRDKPANDVLWGRDIVTSLRVLDLLNPLDSAHEQLREKFRPFLRDTSIMVEPDSSREFLEVLEEAKTFIENNQRLIHLSRMREISSRDSYEVSRNVATALAEGDAEVLEILRPGVGSLSDEYIARRRPVWEEWNTFSRENPINLVELTDKLRENKDINALDNMEYLEGTVLHGISDESESSRKFGVEIEFLHSESSEEYFGSNSYSDREYDDDYDDYYDNEPNWHYNSDGVRRAVASSLYAAGLTETPHVLHYHGTSLGNYETWGLETDETVSGEVVSRIVGETPEFWANELPKVLEILEENNCRPGTSAGLHVHVSTSSYKASPAKHVELIKLTNRFYPILEILGTNPFTKRHRGREGNSYGSAACSLNEPSIVNATDYNRASDRIQRYSGHSSSINVGGSGRYRKSDNVEYRISDSTLNAKQIQTQIIIASFLVEHAEKNVDENGATSAGNNTRTDLAHHEQAHELLAEFLGLFPDNKIRENIIKLFAWNSPYAYD